MGPSSFPRCGHLEFLPLTPITATFHIASANAPFPFDDDVRWANVDGARRATAFEAQMLCDPSATLLGYVLMVLRRCSRSECSSVRCTWSEYQPPGHAYLR